VTEGGFSGIAFAVPLPSCADCGAPFHTLADAFCWSCGGMGPAAPGRQAAAGGTQPPSGPRPIEAIAREVAAAAARAGCSIMPPTGTVLRGLLDELVAAVRP